MTNYYTLGDATLVMQKDQVYETGYPHTMSVVNYSAGGFKYWCFYGVHTYPAGGPVCLARSNDLLTWTKYASNPLLSGTYRWPRVVLKDGIFYMSVTHYVSNLQRIELFTSNDGLTFTFLKIAVPSQAGYYNDGSDLYFNENDNRWYLYWVNIIGSYHRIKCLVADEFSDLDVATPVIVIERPTTTIASPSIMYANGLYWMTVETLPGSVWKTNAFVSASPISDFVECDNSPILSNGDACYFQHTGLTDGGFMDAFYSELSGGAWRMYHRRAALLVAGEATATPSRRLILPATWHRSKVRRLFR